MRTWKRIGTLSLAIAIAILIAAILHLLFPTDNVLAQTVPGTSSSPYPPSITSISVCSQTNRGGLLQQGTCQRGTFDTHEIVLAPIGTTCPNPDANNRCVINALDGMGGISDEMQSIFGPKMLGSNKDYLFWVASGSDASNHAIGSMVLSAGSGPDANGQWTMDFARADGYGFYPSLGFGPLLLPVVGERCLAVPDKNPAEQDQTFDLSYGAPGTIVADPSSPAGNLLMIYEGGNSCAGISTAENPDNNAYLSLAVATSFDYGHTWPRYRYNTSPLPSLSHSWPGPNAPAGASGSSVCFGNDCASTPRWNYGRYPVMQPQLGLTTAIQNGNQLGAIIGDGEPSAFVDDASVNPAQYVYVPHGYKPGNFDPPLANNRKTDLMLARAQFNSGSSALNFMKWDGQHFLSAGIGGVERPILPDGSYQSCGDPQSQSRHMAAINYVDSTQQYLLTFVCDSPTDPLSCPTGMNCGAGAGAINGSAWFYATSYDVSDPTQWSPPQEIEGSWGVYDRTGSCLDYKGYYPTLMTLGRKPGHVSLNGYVFYMWGCQGGGAPGGRQYSSRAFTITTTAMTHHS